MNSSQIPNKICGEAWLYFLYKGYGILSKLNDKSCKCQKNYNIYRLICLKCHTFYIGSTIRPLHIELKNTHILIP